MNLQEFYLPFKAGEEYSFELLSRRAKPDMVYQICSIEVTIYVKSRSLILLSVKVYINIARKLLKYHSFILIVVYKTNNTCYLKYTFLSNFVDFLTSTYYISTAYYIIDNCRTPSLI